MYEYESVNCVGTGQYTRWNTKYTSASWHNNNNVLMVAQPLRNQIGSHDLYAAAA